MTDDAVRTLLVTINAARAMGAVAEVYARMVDAAALMVARGLKGEAAGVLAYVMHQPDVPYDIYDRADDLWIDLESELCPRVISDAKAEATFMSLRGMIEQTAKALLGDDDASIDTLPDSSNP
ncbi:MAG: hypothetical protein IPM16_16665 [Chloroflexi bacterium]|nr:hypothetical protein [Chloroflexota bacterium]